MVPACRLTLVYVCVRVCVCVCVRACVCVRYYHRSLIFSHVCVEGKTVCYAVCCVDKWML